MYITGSLKATAGSRSIPKDAEFVMANRTCIAVGRV